MTMTLSSACGFDWRGVGEMAGRCAVGRFGTRPPQKAMGCFGTRPTPKPAKRPAFYADILGAVIARVRRNV